MSTRMSSRLDPLPVKQASDYVAVTPSDTADLPDGKCVGVYCGVGGDVAVVSPSGSAVTIKAVPAGVPLFLPAKRIKATGTTATNILALY
ncbi:hypothetical protein [Paenibacillus sp. S25]|uniref:spike base protein, RCAP_Rcc01079 family n=1 Tax=Paenibacillus sp. S25 TaxID=2823905 RepID=UPI001C64796A|nr:hypothetical protein [Paenibacillus sp. S25]QYK61855.1 hypothetical protein KAI37_02179 [Paenibacillus sp. S25]